MILEILTRNLLELKKMFVGVSANEVPTLRNSATGSPIFGAIAKGNLTGVLWKVLVLREIGVKFSKYKFS